MKRKLHWRRRTAIFRPLDQSDRLKLAEVHLVRAAALLTRARNAASGNTRRTLDEAFRALDLCCDYVADVLLEKEARQ